MQKKDLPITPPNTITMSLIELIEHLVWMLWKTPCYSFSIMSDKVIVWRKAFAMNNDNRHIPEDAYFRNLHLLPHYVWGAGAETNTFNQSINHLRVWTTNSQKFIKCFLTAIMGVGIYLSTFTKTFFFFSIFVLEEEMLQQVMIYVMSQHSFRINILLCITVLQLHSWVGYSQ